MKNKTKIKSILMSFWTGFRALKKSYVYAIFSFLIIIFGFDVSFAVDPAPATAVGQTTISGFMDILNYLLAGIGTILGVLTGLVALFLNPGWVNGEIFGLTKYLKEMWILVSNVVYFIFAGILIVIAFMNIIGKGGDKFELKQALPKFIVGILIVPFSWFIVQFILSISAILTVSVLTLPYDAFNSSISKEKLEKPIDNFCHDRNFYLQPPNDSTSKSNYNLDIQAGIDTATAKEHSGYKDTFDCVDSTKLVTLKDIIGGTDGKTQQLYGIIGIYSFAVMEIGDLDILKSQQLSTVNSLLSLSAKTLFDITFTLIYVILLGALFLALFVRGIMLWVYAMLSPLFGLTYFLGDKGGESLKKFNFKELFSLAMVPVLVSAALSFGLLFLLVAGHGLTTNPVDSTSGGTYINKDGMNLGFMNINFIGAVGGGSSTNPDGNSPISIFFTGATNIVGWLIIKIFGLVLLWMAVMAALNSSSITKSIIEPIDKFGKSVGSLALSAPKYIPIPGTGGLSAEGLASAGNTVSSAISGRASTQGSKWAQNKFPGLFEGEQDYQKTKIDLDNYKNYSNKKESYEKIMAFLKSKDLESISQRRDALELVATKMEALGVEKQYADKIRAAYGDRERLEQALMEAGNDSYKKDSLYNLFGKPLTNNDEVKTIIQQGGTTTNNNQTVQNLVNVYVDNDGKAVSKSTNGATQIIDENSTLLTGKGNIDLFIKYLNNHKKGIYSEEQIKNTYGEEVLKQLKETKYFETSSTPPTTPSK